MMAWEQDFTPASPQQPQAVQDWQQDFTPANQNNVSNQDANYKGSILPFSNDAQGNTHFDINAGLPGSIIKGVQDLMSPNSYPSTAQTESGGQLSTDALSVLAGVSGLTMSGRTAIPSSQTTLSNTSEGGGGSPSVVVPASSDIKLIKQKLALAGITPEQYADALMRSGPDDFAGEVGGDPLRMQTQAQAKITSDVMQDARDAMRQRMAQAPQRTADIIGQNIKPAENVQNMLQNIDDMKAQAAPLYQQAFQSTVPWDEFSDIIGTPSGQTALQKTIDNFNNANRPPEQMGFSVDQNGKYSLNDDVPIETMHQIQRNIGAQVQRDQFGKPTSDPGNQVLEQQQTGITSRLAALNPSYQKALNVSAAYNQATDAFSLGRQLAKSAAGETADAIMQRADDVMSPNELSYRNAGYAQGLTDTSMGAPLGTGSPASRIATGKVQNSAASIMDSPTQAQQFADALIQEKNRMDLAQRGLGGSNTAETLDSGIPQIPSIMELPGHAYNAAKDFVQQGRNERLAQLLYATSPEQKAILAQKVLGK